MRFSDVERVRSLGLFEGVSTEMFRQVTAGAHLQRFPADTLLLLEGDPADFLYVLLDGHVELHGSWNDKDTTLAILRPVSTFILAAVVLDTHALMTARTLERCEILMISGESIRRAMALDAPFAAAVARDLAGCYRGLVRTIKNQKLRGGAERLANYLLTLRASQQTEHTVRLPYEKRVLASLLGMAPENLSRAFAALQKHGVRVRGAEVAIENPSELERLAKPDPLIDNHAPRGPRNMAESDAEIWSSERLRVQAGR